MNRSADKIGTINQWSANASCLATPPIGCVLHLLGLPGGGSKIYDQSPYGNIGTITGATWIRTPGGLWCLNFDGSDDYVVVADALSLDITDAITLVAWINPVKGTVSGYHEVFDKRGAGVFYNLAVDETDDKLRTAGLGGFYVSNVITFGTWQHIAVTYSKDLPSANIKGFVNGAGVGTQAYTAPIDTNANRLGIGAQNPDHGLGHYLKGCIALPRIYNRALSTLEIQNQFNREKNLFGVW
jgi:hypothetical protein